MFRGFRVRALWFWGLVFRGFRASGLGVMGFGCPLNVAGFRVLGCRV